MFKQNSALSEVVVNIARFSFTIRIRIQIQYPCPTRAIVSRVPAFAARLLRFHALAFVLPCVPECGPSHRWKRIAPATFPVRAQFHLGRPRRSPAVVELAPVRAHVLGLAGVPAQAGGFPSARAREQDCARFAVFPVPNQFSQQTVQRRIAGLRARPHTKLLPLLLGQSPRHRSFQTAVERIDFSGGQVFHAPTDRATKPCVLSYLVVGQELAW